MTTVRPRARETGPERARSTPGADDPRRQATGSARCAVPACSSTAAVSAHVVVGSRRSSTLAVLVVVFTVAGVHSNNQTDALHDHGVPVTFTVTGCLGLLGGSGSNAAGYSCHGTYALDGHRYTEALPGTAFHRPGAAVAAVAVPGDPALVSPAAIVDDAALVGRRLRAPRRARRSCCSRSWARRAPRTALAKVRGPPRRRRAWRPRPEERNCCGRCRLRSLRQDPVAVVTWAGV